MSTLKGIYGANLLFSFHSFLLIYLNSSLLSASFSTSLVSVLYTVSSIASLILVLYFPKLLAKYGPRKTTISCLALEFIAVLGLGLFSENILIALLFILHQTLILGFIFLFDIFLESRSTNNETGRVRAMFLTISNVALVISPAIVGLFAAAGQPIRHVYILSSLLIIPLYILFNKSSRNIPQDHQIVRPDDVINILRHNFNIRGIVLARLILECFYATMVIYMPIYLSTYLDYAWKDIGIIFTVMLLPFVIFEIPAGALSDKKLGEKELLFFGLLIMGCASLFIPFLGYGTIITWAALLFTTRIGASILEIETESYFFKQVGTDNTGIISTFRAMRPLSYIIAPMAVSILLIAIPLKFIFFVLGICVCLGSLTVLPIKDTK